jgi:hypothetical protein
MRSITMKTTSLDRKPPKLPMVHSTARPMIVQESSGRWRGIQAA